MTDHLSDFASGTVLLDAPADGVLRLAFNRPERLNAFTGPVLERIHAALDVVVADRGCRVLVVTGTGRGFCTGFDLQEGYDGDAEASGGVGAMLAGLDLLTGVVTRLRDLKQPVVAAVNGPAVGGGVGFALAADIRLAARSASFRLPQAVHGLLGTETGLSYLLPRAVGEARAAWMLLTAHKVEATTAADWGLVVSVHDDDVLASVAVETAVRIAAMSPYAVQETKAGLRCGLESPTLAHAVAAENRAQALANHAPEMRAAIDAFRASRG